MTVQKYQEIFDIFMFFYLKRYIANVTEHSLDIGF